MASNYINIPNYGDAHWRGPVADFTNLPTNGNNLGDVIQTTDTEVLYTWNGSAWVAIPSGGGGGGSVSSVGLADSTGLFNITNTPVTTTGVLTLASFKNDNAITNANLALVPSDTIKGNNTGSSATVMDLSVSQVKTMLNLSGTNSGDVTLAAVGAVPNANGATLTGQVLNLQPANSTHPGALTAADWNTFNNKLNSIPDVQTAYVNGAGSDSTGQLNRLDLPFLTIAGAMAAITNTSVSNQIVIQTPGVFSVDGLVFKPGVNLIGINPATTTFDFGTHGISFDSGWFSASAQGSINNATISSGVAQTLDLSAATSGNQLFYLINVTQSISPGFTVLGSSTGGSLPTFIFNNYTDLEGGNINITDCTSLLYQLSTFSADVNITCDSSSVGGMQVFLFNPSILGSVSVEGSAGSVQSGILGGSVIQNVTVDGSQAALIVTMGVLPTQSQVSITNGATLTQLGDAYGVPYYPANSANWNGNPVNVTSALDRIAAVVGAVTPIP